MRAARLSARLIDAPTPASVEPVAALGASILHLHLADIAADPARADPAAGKATRDKFTDLTRWLFETLPTTILEALPPAAREPWRKALVAALETRQMQADALREVIVAEQEKRWHGDLQARIAEDWTSLHRDMMTLIRGEVPLPWEGFMHAILLALVTAQAEYSGLPEAERLEKIAGTLRVALAAETQRINLDALRDDTARIDAMLGSDAAALTEIERRFLAAASRCATSPAMAKFAVLELGCAVEWSLLDRLLKPLRTALRERTHQHPITPAGAQTDRPFDFLTGQRAFLMLGDVVRAYTDASKQIAQGSAAPSAQGAIASWLARQPNPRALYPLAPERARRRRAALNDISAARNAVAHPTLGEGGTLSPPPPLGPHWEALVADDADAFFRYFPSLFSDPAQKVG